MSDQLKSALNTGTESGPNKKGRIMTENTTIPAVTDAAAKAKADATAKAKAVALDRRVRKKAAVALDKRVRKAAGDADRAFEKLADLICDAKQLEVWRHVAPEMEILAREDGTPFANWALYVRDVVTMNMPSLHQTVGAPLVKLLVDEGMSLRAATCWWALPGWPSDNKEDPA